SPAGGYRWGPVCGARTVPSLVEPAGTFPPSLSDAAQPEDIARELDAQVERAQACGIRPAYLVYDGADHALVAPALQQFSERIGVPAWGGTWDIEPLNMPEPSTNAFHEVLTRLKSGAHLWLTHPAHASPETGSLWADPGLAVARYAESRALCNP